MRVSLLLFVAFAFGCAHSLSGGSISEAAAEAPPRHDGPFGTPHPMLLQDYSPNGRWITACQAREDTDGDGKIEVQVGHHGDLRGDAAKLYLFMEPGSGELIEQFVATRGTECPLAVIQSGKLVLIDPVTRSRTQLDAFVPPADARIDFKLGDFDEGCGHFAFLREREGVIEAVVRTLKDGTEKTLAPKEGRLHTIQFAPGGDHLYLGTAAKDSNGDGKIEWPRARTNRALGSCVGQAMSYSSYGHTGDRPVFVLASVQNDSQVPVDQVERPFREGVLRRTAEGALVFEGPNGAAEWVPSSCGGEVIHADSERSLLVVACTKASELRQERVSLIPVWLFGPGVSQDLGFRIFDHQMERDVHSDVGGRLVAISAGYVGLKEPLETPAAVIDLAQRKVTLLGRFSVQAVAATRVAGERYTSATAPGERSILVIDVASGEELVIPEAPETYTPPFRAGSKLAMQGHVVDLARLEIEGRLPEEVHGLDDRGFALVPQTPGRPPTGPYRWTAPAPVTKSNAP